jgi:hypothetical protein
MPQNITIIGDSTIDNRVWVEGIKKAFIKEKLGLKVHDAQTHVRQSRRLIGKPKLSVVENLMKLMSVGYQINDLTNDGFTTADVLYGEYRDKVFGVSTFPQRFPHVAFSPLEDGAEAIQNANVIILSIGGNDFREFLMAAL